MPNSPREPCWTLEGVVWRLRREVISRQQHVLAKAFQAGIARKCAAYTQRVLRRTVIQSPSFTPGGTPSLPTHGTMATLAIKASSPPAPPLR